MKYAPLEIKQIACMILVLKKSEKIMVGPGFDLRTSHTWVKHATTEPTLHHAAESKYTGCVKCIGTVGIPLKQVMPYT